MEQAEKRNTDSKQIVKKKDNLTAFSAFAGGALGWTANTSLSMLTDADMTPFYVVSISLGVMIGLLWDISNKMNRD
ncbi:hypothetical protein AS034_20150 [[Bacillus] enclensis]|jgi:hypothetical protein|uniref:Uncharacterized protein n=2 Tax=Rossellomorea TaxID=2837508 RepID=A0A0V8H7E5_9BACI|nr:hypothetical protein [[Bacillus] enclensis]OAT83528.1 hypothetical protein A6P54_21415 [Bacillus sp. MKU004]QTC42868.1 hypothetical protein I7V34_06385 [Bacillus sp. V3]QWC21058.1 hypothetical protein KJK41_11935 [Bacillus haikouensis]KSU58387.1 hypothetical protein AS034_20150 [[Bacillus] enclensis]SCC34811.1 hypothetical protein GA0061094_4175 [[Bacillus] enclensis]